jgi:branched-chain amino acid transport system substrate-binding protein
MRLWYRLFALVMALGLVAAACGDDDDDDDDDASSDTTTAATEAADDTAATETSGATDTSAADDTTGDTTGDTEAPSDLALDEPVSIIVMAETTGESQNAVPNYADAGQMAADDINAAGGVGGHDLEYERISAPLDQAGAEAAALEAVDSGPTAVVGFPSSTQTPFVAPIFTEGETPIIFTHGNPLARLDVEGSIGSEWTFSGRPVSAALAVAQAEYVVEELGFTNVALLCVNNAFGTAGCDAAEPVLEELGATVVAREVHEQDASNVDTQALAIASANAEVVLAFTFPNQVTTLVANADLADTPILGGASAGIAFDGAVRGEQPVDAFVGRVYGIDDCVPAADDRPEVQEWVTAYEERFGYRPDYAAALTYDYVHMVVAAVEAAGSTDHAAVAEALRTIEYEGICDTYQSDEGQSLMNQSTFYVLEEDGRVPQATVEL